MNGQMKKYKEIIKDMPEPIRLKDRPNFRMKKKTCL